MAPLRPSRRSSRPASPAGRTSSAVASPRINVQSTVDEVPSAGQTSLDTWLEPPLRSATAYEDAGMEKSALFENMQPLGTLPNPGRLKYKPVIRSVNEKSSAPRQWGDAVVSTPELTPPVEVQPVDATNGVELPSSRPESVEKEAFPQLNGSHTIELGVETPPLAHDAPSPTTSSHQSLEQKEAPVVIAVGTPSSMTQELPPQQTSTPQTLPAFHEPSMTDTITSTPLDLTDKQLADAVYAANQRAQEAGDEVQGEALLALWEQAKKPGQEELLTVFKATLSRTSTAEQMQTFGVRYKQQRAITKRRLRTKSVNTRPSSISSIPHIDSPEIRQASLPPYTAAAMILNITTTPKTPSIGSNPPNPPMPPMGSFHTTPSRASAKASLLRTPHKEATAKSAPHVPLTPPLQPSPKIRSRKASNAAVHESPANLGKRRRPNKETEVSTSEPAEESTPQAKRRATINAIKDSDATQSDGPKINGAAARMTRSRKSLIEPPESSPKPTPYTPPARTRSGRRRQSSSDLSSVDEEIVNDGPPPPVPVAPKRTAAEALLDERTEQTRRLRARYDSKLEDRQAGWQDLPQNLAERPSAFAQKEQTLKINIAPGRSTRSSVQRRSGRDESAPLTPAAPSPRFPEGLFPGAARATRSSQQFSNAEALIANKPKTGARFKTSPIKDRLTAAGVSRNNGYGGSPPSRQVSPSRGGNDDASKADKENEDDEHSDLCHACGEAGRLICCDSCPNALHYKCCDPPIKGLAEYKNKPFFCQECKKQEQDDVDEASNSNALLRPLFARLLTTNTSSFQLPKAIQRAFVGVEAKDNGEYSDDSKRTVSFNRRNAGYDENGVSREKDQPRLMRCKACEKSSLDGRSIIQCDDCNAQWHLDCLDPPQANPPSVNNINRTRAFFRCPLHVENDMRMFGNARLAYAEPDGRGERGHKLRKLRKARVIRPVIQRGNKNNGYIEVEIEEQEPIVQEDGVVYKLSDTAVKLDFFEKASIERENNLSLAARSAPTPIDIEAEIQRRIEAQSSVAIEAEIQRRVNTQVAQRMAQYQERNRASQIAFMQSSPSDQELIASLIGLSSKDRLQLETENLAVLAEAAKSTEPDVQMIETDVQDTIPSPGNNIAIDQRNEQPQKAITGGAQDQAPGAQDLVADQPIRVRSNAFTTCNWEGVTRIVHESERTALLLDIATYIKGGIARWTVDLELGLQQLIKHLAEQDAMVLVALAEVLKSGKTRQINEAAQAANAGKAEETKRG